MRVIFIGASQFGLKCLNVLKHLPDVSVVGVLTNPRTFSISYSDKPVVNVLHADLVAWAAQNSLPCHEMVRSMHDEVVVEWVRALKPQLFVVAGWYHMVPKVLRDIAPAVGLHASLLPSYSGGAPLVWAMINGERRTGITLFQMDGGVDSGPIIGQAEEPIFANDTIGSLYGRIEMRGLELLERNLPAIAAGSAELRRQDENERRVYPQRCPEDGWIDWNQDAKTIDRFIRAQTYPYPGAFTSLRDGRRLTIWSATPLDVNDGAVPSYVTRKGDHFQVQCAEGSLLLEEISCDDRVFRAGQLEEVLSGTERLGEENPRKSMSSMGT